MSQLTAFLEHVSRVSHQYQALSKIKENLPAGHVILHMDFAENFTCQSLDEIQSAYWNATPVSIHPIVAYVKQLDGTLFHRNFVFISDVLNHNSTAIFAILQKAVPVINLLFSTPQQYTTGQIVHLPSIGTDLFLIFLPVMLIYLVFLRDGIILRQATVRSTATELVELSREELWKQ